jgi:4-amino-4-deoxy-L-arabinose transferase-like glycosyltransferase
MTASLRSEKLVQSADDSGSADGKRYNLLLASVLGIAGGALALWCFFDHSMPSWDAAGHLLNGLSYQELFRHPHPFKLQWWHQLLTVNCFYPPLTYVMAGLVKTIVGTSLWTDALMKVVFLSILNVSVFGLVYKLTKDKLAAIFSVVLINLYPEVAVESHKSMLDFPVMAMTALSLCALAQWQEKPGWKQTLWLAVATSFALLTKQVCAAFLLLPFALCAVIALKERRFKHLSMLIASGLAAGATLVPWLIVSMPTIKRVAAEIQVSLGNKQVSDVFVSNLITYFGFLPVMATPILLLFGCLAVLVSRRATHKQLALLSVSLISGALLLSTLTWQYALSRYFISALVLFAAYSGSFLSTLWRSTSSTERETFAPDSSSVSPSHDLQGDVQAASEKFTSPAAENVSSGSSQPSAPLRFSSPSSSSPSLSPSPSASTPLAPLSSSSSSSENALSPSPPSSARTEASASHSNFGNRNLKRGIVVLVLTLGVLGYMAVNFYPYPITTSPVLNEIRNMALRPVSAITKDRFEHPCPKEDWGIIWTLSKIREADGDSPEWLNVLPSTQQLNVHAFEYFGRQAKFQVHPTTSRSWSAAGDSSKFNEEETLHYKWYLIKSGEQGFKFHDPLSRANFDQLITFISDGKRFTLKGEKELPDGSKLSLYRQKN